MDADSPLTIVTITPIFLSAPVGRPCGPRSSCLNRCAAVRAVAPAFTFILWTAPSACSAPSKEREQNVIQSRSPNRLPARWWTLRPAREQKKKRCFSLLHNSCFIFIPPPSSLFVTVALPPPPLPSNLFLPSLLPSPPLCRLTACLPT